MVMIDTGNIIEATTTQHEEWMVAAGVTGFACNDREHAIAEANRLARYYSPETISVSYTVTLTRRAEIDPSEWLEDKERG